MNLYRFTVHGKATYPDFAILHQQLQLFGHVAVRHQTHAVIIHVAVRHQTHAVIIQVQVVAGRRGQLIILYEQTETGTLWEITGIPWEITGTLWETTGTP